MATEVPVQHQPLLLRRGSAPGGASTETFKLLLLSGLLLESQGEQVAVGSLRRPFGKTQAA